MRGLDTLVHGRIYFLPRSSSPANEKASRETVLSAVEAAERGVKPTAQMKPRLGRSSYLGDRVLGYPDPGAKAISVWLCAASEALCVR